jgi:hypothetical protein
LLRTKIKLTELKYKVDEMAYKSVVGSQQITGMPFVSGTTDKVGDYATRITELEDRYMSMLIQYKGLEKKAKAFITEIPDETISSILYLKYINGYDNIDIASVCGLRGPYRARVIKNIINTFFLDSLLYLL